MSRRQVVAQKSTVNKAASPMSRLLMTAAVVLLAAVLLAGAPAMAQDDAATTLTAVTATNGTYAVSPSNIRADSASAICAAKQAIRQGTAQSLTQVVFIPGFNDAEGHPMIPNVTGVVTNGGEKPCKCKQSKRDNCRCVPDAHILPGGLGVSILPAAAVYLVQFNATSAVSGKTIQDFAELCIIPQSRNLRGKEPPACLPFASSVTVRDATKCS